MIILLTNAAKGHPREHVLFLNDQDDAKSD
jgi:hypothetical protein